MRELIDSVHLHEQTFGDKALRLEVLVMFQTQTPLLIDALLAADGIARSEIAHRLKGSCLAVGAIPLAEAASAIEDQPHASKDIRPLAAETLRAVAKILSH
jgi:HPt (histidine-containing phosphotransfer) domain-containing protein